MQQQANKKQQQRSSSKQTAHSVLCNIYILSTRNFSNSNSALEFKGSTGKHTFSVGKFHHARNPTQNPRACGSVRTSLELVQLQHVF